MRPKANKREKSQYFFKIVLILHFLYSPIAALRCRTDDGPSEAELKRIARSCMRKITENNISYGSNSNGGIYNGPSYGGGSSSNSYGQHKRQQATRFDTYPGQYDHMDYDHGSEEDVANGHNNNNNKYHNNNYFGRFGNGEQDILRQRNTQRQQAASGTAQTSFDYDNNGSGGSSTTGSSSGRNGNNVGGHSNGNSSPNRSNIHRSNNSNSNNNSSNSTYDAACVVHCFFEELHVLNNEEYPDRYKLQQLLVRELRDRELRNFYADTIQQCFHYMESQRRRNKCHYSRELINCMSELAKANCDDWQEYSVIFN